MSTETESDILDIFDSFRQFFALERDVLVLSVAMFGFALAFQTTRQYISEYLKVLGASSLVVGVYGTLGNLIQAIYPYPGGVFSDRIGIRLALTVFGVLSTIGFAIGFRFAGLPAHKALIVGPSETQTGGRVTGTYYLLRNIVVIPSAAVGGWLYATNPSLAFTVASVIGLIGVGYFSVFGEEFAAYTS